jgi:hypothetical protein
MELTGIALLRTIIPDEFANQLVLISMNWRKDKFAIGDIRNSLKAMVEERLLPIAVPDIDDFLAECLSHEVEPRTIRYYAMIAYAFPDPVREKYNTLPHSHFAFAHIIGDKALDVLQLAQDRETHSGKVPSVAWLRASMNGYLYEKQSAEFPIFQDDLGGSGGMMLVQDDDLGGAESPQDKSEPAAPGWLIGLQRVVQFGMRNINAAPLPSEARLKLSDLLVQVSNLLEEYVVMV